MDTGGMKSLLAFYNQTYHGITMAAALRSVGGTFKIDGRLADNMLENVNVIVRSIDAISFDRELQTAWMQVRDWLETLRIRTSSADHSSELYQLNLLAYLTWIGSCGHSRARNFAEENYTVFVHPDQHPGLASIKQMWTAHLTNAHSDEPATWRNLAAILERMGRAGGCDQNAPHE